MEVYWRLINNGNVLIGEKLFARRSGGRIVDRLLGVPDYRQEHLRNSCREHGFEHEVLNAETVNECFPGYDLPDGHRAVYQPDGGFLVSEQCIVAHAKEVQAAGAEVCAREAVTGWEPLCDSGVAVETDRDTYEADDLVVTAGAWAAKHADALRPYLQPERQVMARLQLTVPRAVPVRDLPRVDLSVEEGRYYGFPVYDVPGFKFGRYHHQGESADDDYDDESNREVDVAGEQVAAPSLGGGDHIRRVDDPFLGFDARYGTILDQNVAGCRVGSKPCPVEFGLRLQRQRISVGLTILVRSYSSTPSFLQGRRDVRSLGNALRVYPQQ